MIQPIILAAGKGTRLRSSVPKTLFPVNGKPIVSHIIETLQESTQYAHPIIVVGHEAHEVKNHLGESYTYATQENLTGTATAVMAALPFVGEHEYVVVVYGDHPYIGVGTFAAIANVCARNNPFIVAATYEAPERDTLWPIFKHYGRVIRNSDDDISHVVEYKNASATELNSREVSSGVLGIQTAWLRTVISRVKKNPDTNEHYLTELFSFAYRDGKPAASVGLYPLECVGINSQEDVVLAESLRSGRA